MPGMSRRMVQGGIAAALLMMVPILGSPVAADVKTARLGHSFTDSHPRAAAMKLFAAEVASATGGPGQDRRVRQLDPRIRGEDADRDAGRDDRLLHGRALADRHPQEGNPDLRCSVPVPASNAEAAAVIRWPADEVLDGLADMNLQGWPGRAARSGTCRTASARSTALADMKGLKVRVMRSPMAPCELKENAMGLNAVPMAFTEVYTALETKALDGYEHPVVDMYANKMFEVQKYLTITNHVYTPVALVASEKLWYAFSAGPAGEPLRRPQADPDVPARRGDSSRPTRSWTSSRPRE